MNTNFTLESEKGFLYLKKPIEVEAREECFYVPAFRVSLPKDCTVSQIKGHLARRYKSLESRIAQGLADEQEQKKWMTICEYVDRDKILTEYVESTPVRRILQLSSAEEGKRNIVDACFGLNYPIPENSVDLLKDCHPGDWFEAMVYQDREGNILKLEKVKARPDYGEEK